MSAKGFASHSGSWPSGGHRVLPVIARMNMLPAAAGRQPVVSLHNDRLNAEHLA